jgi:hypothetical protein
VTGAIINSTSGSYPSDQIGDRGYLKKLPNVTFMIHAGLDIVEGVAEAGSVSLMPID